MVTPEWVEQSEREQRFVNEEEFTLRDLDAEEAFAMDIPTALTQARGKLLQVGKREEGGREGGRE